MLIVFFDGGNINHVFVCEKLDPDMRSESSFILPWAIDHSIFD